jgi:fibronectin type III domain protein
MGTFPRTEATVAELAETLVTGLEDNVLTYPAPTVSTVDLDALMTAYTDAKNAMVAATAAAETATNAKVDAMEGLVAAMKSDLRYAENTVDFEDDKLKLLGWSGRKTPTPQPAPGQVQLLEVTQQGEGWLALQWEAPNTGGKPDAYKVMRRQRPEGQWSEVHTAVTTEANLINQPRGLELEYRIIAVNKAGEGQPSNTEMVVL